MAVDIRNDDYQREVHSEIDRCDHICWQIRLTDPMDKEKIRDLEAELFNNAQGEGAFLTPPVFIDCASQVHLGRNVYINHNLKRNAWIGARVSILPGVTIGENAIVGTGSVVTKNIPDNCIAVGNPAKVIKTDIMRRTE